MKSNIRSFVVIVVPLLSTARLAAGYNILNDPGFESPFGTPGDPYSFSGVGLSEPSADNYWPIYNFNNGTTTTWEETPPVGLNGTGQYSMLVSSAVAGNGVGQELESEYFASAVASIGGYVYLDRVPSELDCWTAVT